MMVSLNEVENACHRAALGVGLSQGLAEDASWIGASLVTTRRDGLARMLAALRQADFSRARHPAFTRSERGWVLDPSVPALVAGPALSDLLQAEPHLDLEIGPAAFPEIFDLCRAGRQPPPGEPLQVDDDQWRELLALAARTYVPASEASRQRGAGPANARADADAAS
jgi:Protein of unknown function (DUF3726)